MKSAAGRHWHYQEAPGHERQLKLFDLIGLKKSAKHFLGPSPDRLYEAVAGISSDIHDKSARLHDSHGLSQIRLNSHTALLLFFENVLTVDVLAEADEDEQSIIVSLFNVPLVIQDNPEFAIAYYDPNGLLLAA